MRRYESVRRQLGQQTRRKEEFKEDRDMWKRLALGLPGADGKHRRPYLPGVGRMIAPGKWTTTHRVDHSNVDI
jgi:hypothetical protein